MKKNLKIVIFISNNDFSQLVLQKLDSLSILPEAIIEESKGRKMKQKIKKRIGKYGWMSTIIWIFHLIQMKVLHFIISKNRYTFKNKEFKEVIKVSSINSRKAKQTLNEIKLDIIINTCNSIISKEILNIPIYGIYGVHPGILPKYVGLSSIYWQIFDKNVPGFTVFKLAEKVDSGPSYVQEIVYPKKNETLNNYSFRFSNKMADSLCNFINNFDIKIKPIQLNNEISLNRGLITLDKLKQVKTNWKILLKSVKV